MMRNSIGGAVITSALSLTGLPAAADPMCASPAQAREVQAFYDDKPGTMPPIAARRLNLPEEIVVSGLPPAQAASAPGSAFPEVWAAMTEWSEATFLIMKGANAIEIRSAVGQGSPSTRSDYYNIEYVHPFRGHLRPDLYTSIYGVILPREGDVVVRGVLFYDPDGESVFGTFVSGDGPPPPASELEKFDRVMDLIRSKPSVCEQ